MRLIRFKDPDDFDVWINPEHVIAVFPAEDGHTIIDTLADGSYGADCRPQEVVRRLLWEEQ